MSHLNAYRSFRLFNNVSHLLNYQQRTLPVCGCLLQTFFSTKVTDPTGTEKKRPKTAIIPKITLILGDNINVTTLEEAQRLSKRRDLKLVKIVDMDTKTQRPVYKLMTGAEYHEEDLKQREQRKKEKQNSFIKGEKVLLLSGKIAQHDLEVHIRKISKWIAKHYEVRVVIGGEAGIDRAEEIYKLIEDPLKSEARIVQKRQKGSDIKFQIIPLKKDNPETEEKNL